MNHERYRLVDQCLFLPGFLGCKEDWEEILSHINNPNGSPLSWEEIERGCPQGRFHLVGYSMGGRVAASWATTYPERIASLTLLSTHLGLRSEKERKKRTQIDQMWAENLLKLPILEFLNLWYGQPLFLGFRWPNRRLNIDPSLHAKLLLKYSLGKSPYYWNQLACPTLYLVGEKDTKYRSLKHSLPTRVIQSAGHPLHLEAPAEVAKWISYSLGNVTLLS